MRRVLGYLLLLCAVIGCATTKVTQKHFVQANRITPSVTTIDLEAMEKKPASAWPVTPTAPVKQAVSPDVAIRKANEGATRNPDQAGFFNAAMAFDWEPGSLYQIYAAPLRITDIALEPGEKITSISGGDTTRWQVQQTSSGFGTEEQSHVLIKPLRADLKTNLVIMTGRGAYHLEIHSLEDGNYMASVSWNYPKPMVIVERSREEEDVNDIEKLDLSNVNFNYHFVTQKKPSWMPIRAFDDGQKTYVEFPVSAKAREMPGLFVLSSSGGTEIVNYRSSGSFYVVDRLVDVLELRLGSDNPEIVGIERL